jgi:hypothetical protein
LGSCSSHLRGPLVCILYSRKEVLEYELQRKIAHFPQLQRPKLHTSIYGFKWKRHHKSFYQAELNYQEVLDIIPAMALVATKIEHCTPKFHEMLQNKHTRGQNVFNVIRKLAHFKLELGAYFFARAQQKWLLQNFICNIIIHLLLILGVTE